MTRHSYTMSSGVLKMLERHEGHKPFCLKCGDVFNEGDRVLSKAGSRRLAKGGTRKTHRYHIDCAEQLRIWAK